MDSVRLRLEREQPLTFLEFNYMILQGYDFLELNKRYGCTLQMGGSDQWGNIVREWSSDGASRERSYSASPRRSSRPRPAPRWARRRAAPCG